MRISSLEPDPRRRGWFTLTLEDGSQVPVGEGDVAAFSVWAGMEAEAPLLEELQAAGRRRAVRERAARMLGCRPMSRGELLRQLGQKGACSADAEEAADWLEQLGILRDADFARLVVRRCAAKGYGRLRMREELRRHLVPRQLWEDALEGAPDGSQAIDSFLQKKLGTACAGSAARKRAADALLRRGFSWQEIREGLRRMGAEEPEDCCP